jgi:hypothetical protein
MEHVLANNLSLVETKNKVRLKLSFG